MHSTRPQSRSYAPHRNEVRGAADLIAGAVDVLTRPLQGTHAAISDSVFRVLGPPAAPVRVLHDAITTLTYAAIRGGTDVLAEAVLVGSDALPPAMSEHAVTSTATGSVIVGAVNGLLGDRMVAEGNDLAVAFGPHHRRRVVGADTALLTETYPDATGHLAVLVHGLGETEQGWYYRHGGRGSYGELLANHGISAVVMRYNTGTGIVENGAVLAELLAELITVWPVPVTRVDLVGHSMGGLVLRRACSAEEAATMWLPLVRTVCYLGTPHEGAPLAAGTYRLSKTLRRTKPTQVWADLLDVRSEGIENLRRATDLPLVAGVRHVAVAATLARDPSSWWAGLVGDGLVTPGSARGPVEEVHTLPGTGHLSLLADPRVADVLVELMTDASPGELDDAVDPGGTDTDSHPEPSAQSDPLSTVTRSHDGSASWVVSSAGVIHQPSETSPA